MRAFLGRMIPDSRQLMVFFCAGATRYALDALRVLEVLRSEQGPLALEGHWPLRQVASLLGGDEEEVRAAIVIEVSPTVALGVARIDGVFDCAGLPRWPVHGRLVPLVAPAICATFLFEGRLIFELDAEGAVRGLPRQLRPLERHLCAASKALVFDVQGTRWGIPLAAVVQVLEPAEQFNRSPNAGSFLGVVTHRHQLCPIYTVGTLGAMLPFVVLFELRGGEVLGLTATRVEGVHSGAALAGVDVLDVERMFAS